MFADENPITNVTRTEAWALLRGRTMGRLAVSVDGQPDIFPINYYADDNSILMRTAPGTKLLDVAANQSVAFETDVYGPHEAWSVVVKGRAVVLENKAEVSVAMSMPLRSWLPTEKPVFVRILPTDVTGRRFRLASTP
jgi:nitroimidazol reductase NimA-like FMN-containing flavoprotein (pyridoxamine 5'-phosphate oxidase superfamily)